MIEQINREIAALEATVKEVATELENAYISYLTSLGQAVTKQLMLASYHVCTQGYPKQFVSLSFNQRQQLQQDIRALTQKAAEQLLQHTQVEHPLEFSFLVEEEPISFSNPLELMKWQHKVENAIAHTLKTLSSQTNSVLQAAQILPNNLPLTPLLEAATSSPDDTPEVITGLPNLLNLLIETDSDNEAQESNVTQIVAIHLRLIDIEFADSTVRAKRNQIRNLSTKVSKLEREYQKKQREKDVAEAEAAWRGSWFES